MELQKRVDFKSLLLCLLLTRWTLTKWFDLLSMMRKVKRKLNFCFPCLFDVFSVTYCYSETRFHFFFYLFFFCVLQSSIIISLLSDIGLNKALISFFDWDTKPNGHVTIQDIMFVSHLASLNLLESPIFRRLVCNIRAYVAILLNVYCF